MTLRVRYTPGFVRQYKNLPKSLQDDVKERIALFRSDPRHSPLRTHRLKGRLQGQWSFRVNYRYRMVFCYDDRQTVALLAVGDHDIYE